MGEWMCVCVYGCVSGDVWIRIGGIGCRVVCSVSVVLLECVGCLFLLFVFVFLWCFVFFFFSVCLVLCMGV